MTREDAIDIIKCLAWHTRPDEEDVEQAIKALEQESCEDWYDVPSNEMTLEQARQAVTDLRKKLAEHLEQEPKTGHWIPVSERLPEINDDVLISLEWGIDIGRYSDGEWCSEWINNYDDGNVYAWMPLPEPYEPQESEDKE
jgi:hypothetical protein